MKVDFRESMRKLDIDQGGIFPEIKRSIVPNTSCLIVSFGGTGSDALEVIKKNLERNVDEGHLKKYVRLLAIDTDVGTKTTKVPVKDGSGQVTMKDVDRFTDNEFFWLDNAPARQAIGLYNSDTAMKQWINPRLPEAIKANPTLLNGKGASSTRQLGRVLLYPKQTVIALQTKITTLVGDITNGNNNRLKVLVISGISGGTGSGTVVDGSYLIRSFISPMTGGVGDRTDYLGFLLLPPTGMSTNPTDISKGNRNGVAALKEIDHFMTIAFREELYSANIGGKTVVSKDNIFETCYLIDGVHTGFAVTNPREKANEVVSDCILDMLTSQPIDSVAGQTAAGVDSFMSDAAAYSVSMVTNNSEHLAPRNANYVYCAIGHGKTLIPLDLMKAYVAKTVFDQIYALYLNCGKVKPTDAKSFVEKVKVKPFNRGSQAKAIAVEVDKLFANPQYGPFYTINLMREVAQYAAEQQETVSHKALMLAATKQELMAQYAFIRSEALRLNKETFEVYTKVLDEMKRYLDDQHGILCNSKRLEQYSGSTYTFTPIDFGGNDVKAQKVRQYLDGLVNAGSVRAMARDLIQEMASHRVEWTQLDSGNGDASPKFDAAMRIRTFWAEKIGAIVSSTIEDYLLKYYSGNPDAKYQEVMTDAGPQATQETLNNMAMAADAIVKEMWGGAGVATPLAELQTGILPMDNFNGHNLFLVPKSAPHLREAIEATLAAKGIKNVVVRESFADDRLSCYSQYTGIPAFMFAWTFRAEPDYEAALSGATLGLHMSETKGGERWQDYPNLLVENIWDKLSNPPYSNPREHNINQRNADLFARAGQLGLTQKSALATLSAVGEYTMFTLPAAFRPDAALFKDYDTELEGSDAWKKAEKRLNDAVEQMAQGLLKKENWETVPALSKKDMMQALENASLSPVTYAGKRLNFVNTVMTPLVDQASPVVPAGWEEKLAAELLRTCPSYMFDVRGTVLVMERLFELVSKAQAVKMQLQNFASFLAAGLFQYDGDLGVWMYDDEFGAQQVLTVIEYGNSEKEAAQYYFMFEDYKAKEKSLYNALQSRLQEIDPPILQGDSLDTIKQKQVLKKAFREKAADLKEKVSKTLIDKTNPEQDKVLSTMLYENNAKARGYDVDGIRKFYRSLDQQLGIL
ncbi:MAG: tubulin-like doman-containing protein [Candidatus Limivicinus sp.]|nr:tubulin-like doman-containing protein [Clostridiales bacterium]MDY6132195.1 tubulin-like doman-containing protein [Candidatus Limivicinus sp.]